MDSSSASGGSIPLSDVTLAWNSLQKAKAVLQRIENKFCHQTRSCANSQAARRKLWHGESFGGERNRDETALKEKKSSEVPVSCRKRNCAALFPARSQPCFHGSCAASPGQPMAMLAPGGCPPTAPAWMGAANETQPIERSSREDFGEWEDSGGHELQKGKHHCSPHHTHCPLAGSSQNSAPVPKAVLLPVHYLPSASSPSDQKLEELQRMSSWKKLEQLKKKIQEQKQNQRAASQEQKCLIASRARELLQDRPLKRKVCRVPAAPAPRPTDQRKIGSARGPQTQSQKQPLPRSSSLGRTAVCEGSKLSGASAWREGQKLARKLLGPPPAFPKLRSRAEEQSTGNAYGPDIAMPAMENSSRENNNEPVGNSPEFQSCAAPHHGPSGRSSSAPTKGAKQILRSLHLQSQCHDDSRQSGLLGDTMKGKVLQQYHPPSPRPQDTTPSAFSAGKRRAALITAGANASSSGSIRRGKSTSQRWTPVQKGSEKENLKQPPKRGVNLKKPHPYSRDAVQEFMCRKNEERKKKKLEEKKSVMQAVEMRNKRLQEVYRKQREALGKKTCSEQMCKLIRGAAAAKGSPQRTLEQKQTSGGNLKHSFMAWVEKASHAALHRDPGDRNQLLETIQSLKNREALPSAALLASESWLPSPLKCQDLRDLSPPALDTPPLSFSPPQKDTKPDFKDSTSGLSPYRNEWDRVKAIHSLSKELAEKIEMATKRLSATSSGKDSAGKISAETTWDLFNESSVPEPEASKDEQDGTMTIQMLLGAPGPDELHVPSNRECHRPGRVSLVDSTEGTADLDRKKKITSLSGGSAVSKEWPWVVTHSIRKRHPNAGESLSSTLEGFPVNKGSEVDMSLLHEKPISSPASPSHRFLARSLQTDPAAQRCEAVPELQDRGAAAQHQPCMESLRTAGSRTLQPCRARGSTEQHCGEADRSCAELKEKHRNHLHNLKQTSLLLAYKLKAHQLQQKQWLTVLSEKAKLELQESQRFLSDLLQNDLKLCSSSKGSDSPVPKLDHAEQTWAGHQTAGDSTVGSSEEMHSLEQFPLNMERDQSPVNSKTVGQRKSLGGRSSHGSALHEGSLPAEDGEPLNGHQDLNLQSAPTDLPHGESCTADGSGESSDQDSQWSDVGRHYGCSSSFCCFSLAMAEQCLRGEELRARHQAALLELRRRALRDKARAELAWLSHQRRCLELLQDAEGASAMAEKQRKVLTELKQEQVEIQHLQNIYRAAHQERKLLLKQQREILMIRQSTAKLQEELHHLTGKKKLTRSPATEEVIKPKKSQVSNAMLGSSLAESTRPDVPGDKQNCVQLKNKQNKKYDGFSTKNKKTLLQYQEQTEEPLSLQLSLGAEGPDVSGTEAKEVCDDSSQTTGVGCMIKHTTNAGGDTSFLEDQENDSVTVEKAPREQRNGRTSRKEQDSCSPFQAGTSKKDLSFDDQDSEKRSAPMSSESTAMETQLRKESSLAELRVSPDSERESQTMHVAEKSPSEILFSVDVPREVEMSAPCEIHQADGSQCLKPLDHNSQETSDEELQWKAFSKGLGSTESLLKSNSFSPCSESARSDCSLPDFQKASAVWIDVSECSISESELAVQNAEDTDVSIPEELVYDAGPNTPKETPIDSGSKTLHSEEHNERGVSKDDSSTEISSCSQIFQKCPEEASAHGCTGHLLSFLSTDKANTSKTTSLDSSQLDKPTKGMDKPRLEASENSKNAAASSFCNDDIYLLQIYEQHNPNSIVNKSKKNDGIKSLLGDQSLPLMDSLKPLDVAANQFSSTVSFLPDKDAANDKLVACSSSRNAAVQNDGARLLNEKDKSEKLDKIVSLPLSIQGISEEVHTETTSFGSLQSLAPGIHKNSKTDRQATKGFGNGQFSSVSSKKQLFQSESSFRSEDYTIFISDEGLPLADEATLSEILSPVDEVLSYGSADLPSSNKKDLSFLSEDLPPPPLGADTMKNDDSSFSIDDFPSPPEQMTVPETGQCMNEDISLKMDAFSPLSDNAASEEYPLLNKEPVGIFSTQEGNLTEQYLVEEISCAKEHLSEYQEGEQETPLQSLEPVSNPISSSQASRNPSVMKQCKTYVTLPAAEEDSDDPLSSFEIGDRVLVKQTRPGTLMFKGRTCFDSGHWAGVALDKAEGDHAGTYQGVKYFECAQLCGIFVRPGEISHLLEVNKKGSSSTEDEDSDSYDDESFKRCYKYPEVGEQGAEVTEQKAGDTKSAGGSEVSEKQPRLYVALRSGKSQTFPYSDNCKCDEYHHQNNFMCWGSDNEKTGMIQIKQGMLAHVPPKENKITHADGINTSKNVCCLVEDQIRNKLTDDIAAELSKKLLFDALIAFSEAAQHKYKSAFEDDVMNYIKGLKQGDIQKQFLIKENPVSSLTEQSAEVADLLRHNFNMLSIHGCHPVAKRIVTKFVDDAVKEYKKIKRKQGVKTDKRFPSSSETSPTTLPFLIRLLDAGVFGSSKDFDQPNSNERALERQTQKQYLLDHWHSAPWKKTVEVPLVVPHCVSYVKNLSAYAVEELWTPENIYSNFTRTSVPKKFECNDFPGNDLETESKRMYNQVIFDLTHELLRAEYQVAAHPNSFPWLKENLRSCRSGCHCRSTDVDEVKTFVQGEIIKIMNLERNDLERKRKFLNMTKYGNRARDRVDLILVQELHKEEPQWTYYDDDELTVKMSMTEDIFDSLILDTVRVLNKIYLRKARD